jgi:hypothetical protein
MIAFERIWGQFKSFSKFIHKFKFRGDRFTEQQNVSFFYLCIRKDKYHDKLPLLLKFDASPYSPSRGVLILSELLARDATDSKTELELGFTHIGAISCTPLRATACRHLIPCLRMLVA